MYHFLYHSCIIPLSFLYHSCIPTGASKGYTFIIYEKSTGVDYAQAAKPHK